MSSIIKQLQEAPVWDTFLSYKLARGQFTWSEYTAALAFVEERRYMSVVQTIIEGGSLGTPHKRLINKLGNDKKRTVYCFAEEEVMTLKLIAFLLYRYDDRQPVGCWSFRPGVCARQAIRYLNDALKGGEYWAYKLDVHNYFNSISISRLLPLLRRTIDDDPLLYSFFERLLTHDKAIYAEHIIREERGVMAGTPTAPFLANIYLAEMDNYFTDNHIIYARYSDDVILFASTYETLMQHRDRLQQFLNDYQLTVNPDKERIFTPDEAFEYLGFKCHRGCVDLSEATKRKLKGKIRRKARALRRWSLRRNIAPERAMSALIKRFNSKFFDEIDTDELTWSRWFFPLLNQIEGLREIDHYLQQELRYLSSGRHSKTNFRVRYETLKKLGYKSLVNEYYKSK
jgi:hypothetical protein